MAVGDLIALLAAHLVLTALPGVAAVLLAARGGQRSVPVLLAIGLAATGVVAIVSFWAYYADHTVGQTVSFLVLFGSVALTAWLVYEGGFDRDLMRSLATPLVLWMLGSAFLVFFGFLHGGTDKPIEIASVRFSTQLPSDNDLPHYFTEWFYANGHSGHPFYGPDWLASDRPPLQIGYMLSQRPFAFVGEGLNYQVLGVMLQQLWIVALWALLVAARLGRVTRALTIVTVLVSDVALLNGFYVWPKLLPAAMLLAAAALVLTPVWGEIRRRPWAGLLVGGLLGLALLGHGSSIFGAIPIALVAAYRGLPSWRWLGAAALALVLLMAPWSAYQKYGEPPGNRLTKYSLAGVAGIDGRGTGEAIVDAYREAGISGTIENKAKNFETMIGGKPALDNLDFGHGFRAAVESIREDFFFDFFPSLGLLLIAPFVMLAARRRGRGRPEEWRLALTLWAVVFLGCLTWGLLMFGNLAARAVLHVDSYAMPILAFTAAVVGLRATFPRFAIWFVGVAATLMFALYVPAFGFPPEYGFSPLAGLIAALCLGGFIVVALRSGLEVLGDSRRLAGEEPGPEGADGEVDRQRRQQVQGAAGNL